MGWVEGTDLEKTRGRKQRRKLFENIYENYIKINVKIFCKILRYKTF